LEYCYTFKPYAYFILLHFVPTQHTYLTCRKRNVNTLSRILHIELFISCGHIVGYDLPSLCDQHSSHKHVSTFE